MVVLVKNDLNIFRTIFSPLITFIMQPFLILVEYIGKKKIREEVEAGQHEEHEQEGIKEAHTLSGQEDIRVVSCGEKNGQIAVSVTNRTEVLDTLESRTVEVVASKYEDEDVGEDGDQDSARAIQVLEETHH